MAEPGQLPLDLRWPPRQRFEHFVVGANALALAACVQAAQSRAAPWLYLSGPRASGKTHLLLATCQQASSVDVRAQYLPLRSLPAPLAAAIRGVGESELVAIDDLDSIAGDSDAEHALFDLYNRCRAEHATLLVSASAPAGVLGLGLDDLVSRLSACTQLPLRTLDEGARRSLLRDLASARGMVLEDPVLDWMFRYHARDLGSLTTLLKQLDQASLAAQRRITVPFVRDVLVQASHCARTQDSPHSQCSHIGEQR